MSRLRVLACALALTAAAGACSASPTPASAPRTPAATPAKKATAARTRGAPPPVRLFAGVQSALGSVAQFCRGTRCDTPAIAPRRLPIGERSVVTFAVDAAPDLAVLEVSGSGARRVALPVGALMPLQGRLAPGAHRLSLQLRWGASSGTWVFDVVVRRQT